MFWNAKNGCVNIGDTDMYYVSFGHGKKVLVLLPGLSDGLAIVKGKVLLLAKPYRKFFNDYTVYMFSRKNEMPENYSIRDMADDQAGALKNLGITKASVMGVSQGGMMAQYLAIDYPQMIEKLVIAVSAPKVNGVIQDCVSKWIKIAERGDHKNLMIDIAEKNYSEKYLKKYRKLYPILGKIGKPENYNRFFINANAILKFDADDELHKIVCPTFIIGGEGDKTVGINASYEMNEKIKNSELYIYKGLGHAAYEEARDFISRIYDFLLK